MSDTKFNITSLYTLVEEDKQQLRQRFKSYRGEDSPGPVLCWADLLDALPYYRQVLLSGTAETQAEDFFRNIAFGMMEKEIAVLYFFSGVNPIELLNYYCTRKTEVTSQQLEIGSFSPKQLKEIYDTLDWLRPLPLRVASASPGGQELFSPRTDPTAAPGPDCSKFWAIDSLRPFLPTDSAEDEKTKRMTLLNQLKAHAQAQQQTHLILLQTEQETVTDMLRPETLKIPDLGLTLDVEIKEGKKIYRLYSQRNTLSDPFELCFSYNTKRNRLEDA